jgi:Fibronectin type III domain
MSLSVVLSERTFNGVTIYCVSSDVSAELIMAYRVFHKLADPSYVYNSHDCCYTYDSTIKIKTLTSSSYALKVNAIRKDGLVKETIVSVPPFVAAAVGGLSCVSTGSQSIDVSWSPVSGAEGFLVQYKLSSDPTYATLTSYTTSVQLANLVPATYYSIRIMAIDGTAYGPNVSCKTLYPPPTTTVCNSCTDVNAQITWAAVTGATSYVLNYKLTSANDSTYTATGALTSSPYTILGLLPNTSYTVRVNATGGMSGTPTVFSTMLPAPTATASPTQTDVNAQITWAAVTGATSYVLNYKLTSANDSTYIATGMLTSSPYTILGLLPNTTYTVRVNATGGMSGSPSYATTLLSAPTATASPTQTDVNAQLTWTPVTGATFYGLSYKLTSANDSTYIIIGPITSSPYTILGLLPNTSYTVKVKGMGGLNAMGGVSSAPITFSTMLPAPASVYASAVTYNSMQITWTNVVGAARYILQYKPSYGSVFSTIDPANSPYNIPNVASSTTYNVQVMAFGGRTSATTVATSAIPPPPPPVYIPPPVPASPITISYTSNDGWVRWTVAAGTVFDHFIMSATNSSGASWSVNCATDSFKPLDVLLGMNPIPVGAYSIKVEGYSASQQIIFTKTLNIPDSTLNAST